jgi:hypothetical protein
MLVQTARADRWMCSCGVILTWRPDQQLWIGARGHVFGFDLDLPSGENDEHVNDTASAVEAPQRSEDAQPVVESPATLAAPAGRRLVSQEEEKRRQRRLALRTERTQWLAEHGMTPKPNRHHPGQPSRSKAARRAERERAKARARGEFVLAPREEKEFLKGLKVFGIPDPRVG